MFGRGNWAIVGLGKESLESFSITLADPIRMAVAAQLAASAVARLYGSDATGINPYNAPRLDEEQEHTLEQQTGIVPMQISGGAEESPAPWPIRGFDATAPRKPLRRTPIEWSGTSRKQSPVCDRLGPAA